MKRFILLKEGIEIGKYQTIKEAANVIGCTFQHVYKNDNGFFKYKKIQYQIIDRLTELD
jgi:hypothetical protein